MFEPKEYTHVAVQMYGGGWNLMDAKDYDELPEDYRYQLQREHRVSFILEGEIVEK